jgi:hypothetical protein
MLRACAAGARNGGHCETPGRGQERVLAVTAKPELLRLLAERQTHQSCMSIGRFGALTAVSTVNCAIASPLVRLLGVDRCIRGEGPTRRIPGDGWALSYLQGEL